MLRRYGGNPQGVPPPSERRLGSPRSQQSLGQWPPATASSPARRFAVPPSIPSPTPVVRPWPHRAASSTWQSPVPTTRTPLRSHRSGREAPARPLPAGASPPPWPASACPPRRPRPPAPSAWRRAGARSRRGHQRGPTRFPPESACAAPPTATEGARCHSRPPPKRRETRAPADATPRRPSPWFGPQNRPRAWPLPDEGSLLADARGHAAETAAWTRCSHTLHRDASSPPTTTASPPPRYARRPASERSAG
mmetsp:Transcript_1956/g.4456  ORF Transcript_1956/g.4456 Transcript_1956/m.4456 type:complete len:251 (+) Transcript_1956:1147-1899(+)